MRCTRQGQLSHRGWLLLALLAAAALVAGAAEPAKAAAKDGPDLEKAVEQAAEAQEFREEADAPVVAQVVKEEGAAALASGDGDVSTTGGCRNDVDLFCLETKPGEGRLADCLTAQLKEESKDHYEGTAKISKECRKELDAFKIDRSKNINKDLPLAKACKKDAEKLCKDNEDGGVLACLRRLKDDVSEKCKEEIFKKQEEAAEDFRTDRELFAACQVDAEQQCAGVDPHGGLIQECLRGKRALLSWDCQEQLFRQEMENADDLRLSVRLFKKCLGDKKKFCPDIAPGNARAKECLEEHREDEGFSEGCKAEIEKVMEQRAADFRLDSKLRELCAQDIEDVCGYERDSLDSIAGYDARVIQCLQDFREEIQSPACMNRVHKIMELASSNIRFDVPLADACFEDRQNFCQNVPPGSARVIRCLQDRREELSYECKATLFDQEVRMAESIDFQFPMKKQCSRDIQKYCAQVPHGHARIVRCLQDNIEQADFSEECKSELTKHEQHASEDYRLNYRLSKACHDTISEKCSDVCTSFSVDEPCGGTVLRCLTEKVDEIENEECKNEVFYFQKMEVRDFRNDVILAEACRKDVEQYCAAVEPGEGRVHQCLRDNRSKLTDACRKEETKLAIMASANTELMPRLNKACAEERQAHCKGVRPGKARVFNCLVSASTSVEFSSQCRAQLTKQMEARIKDWRLDYNLRQSCREDVASICSSAVRDEDKANGAVLQCLITSRGAVSDRCAKDISRSVKNALLFYQQGLPVTSVCDADVASICLKDMSLENVAIGKVRDCLVNQLPPDVQAEGEGIAQAFELPATATAAGAVPADPTDPEVEVAKKPASRRALKQDAAEIVLETVGEQASEQPASSGKSASALQPQCEALVRVSDPGDAYVLYSNTLAASALSTQLKGLETAFGFKEGTLYKNTAAGGVTLTGWSALAGMFSLVIVIVGGAFIGYRRYMGLDSMGGYTMVLKAPTAFARK